MESTSPRLWAARYSLAAFAFVTPLSSGWAEAPVPPAKGGFTLAVLPDTQMYAWKDPSLYRAQTQWVAEHVEAHAIPMVLHLGDVTQHNTDEQWKAARVAHDLMKDRVPCAIAPGNHDLGPEGTGSTRDTLMSLFFPLADFQRWESFGGVYDKEPERTENNWHRFEAGGRKWLVIALEFGPRDDVLRWAGEIVQAHPDHSAILITHAYLRPDDTRFNRGAKVEKNGKVSNKGLDNYALSKAKWGFNDGEDVWQKLVSQHANFFLVISGHVCVTGRRTDAGKHGNSVHQMVVDYQNQDRGGNGFLRLLQFAADGKSLHVVDYSPVLDAVSELPNTNYTLDLPPLPTK